ncbi:hypothetical protein J8273_6295 [Carpediemonas membranifera]|uniref:Uncharacterized protein n=1 Tax=Carpediemonas membranifera TaxID=201153 RepID=A0A8J6AQK4_9EUKA|nr:hypothetical protein J8273_6295 [Carpediemonas membranifera]|eukprot:KAG9391531.1 hypothetical protein J8273_6295 [Carpediemonas membranifera]
MSDADQKEESLALSFSKRLEKWPEDATDRTRWKDVGFPKEGRKNGAINRANIFQYKVFREMNKEAIRIIEMLDPSVDLSDEQISSMRKVFETLILPFRNKAVLPFSNLDEFMRDEMSKHLDKDMKAAITAIYGPDGPDLFPGFVAFNFLVFRAHMEMNALRPTNEQLAAMNTHKQDQFVRRWAETTDRFGPTAPFPIIRHRIAQEAAREEKRRLKEKRDEERRANARHRRRAVRDYDSLTLSAQSARSVRMPKQHAKLTGSAADDKAEQARVAREAKAQLEYWISNPVKPAVESIPAQVLSQMESGEVFRKAADHDFKPEDVPDLGIYYTEYVRLDTALTRIQSILENLFLSPDEIQKKIDDRAAAGKEPIEYDPETLRKSQVSKIMAVVGGAVESEFRKVEIDADVVNSGSGHKPSRDASKHMIDSVDGVLSGWTAFADGIVRNRLLGRVRELLRQHLEARGLVPRKETIDTMFDSGSDSDSEEVVPEVEISLDVPLTSPGAICVIFVHALKELHDEIWTQLEAVQPEPPVGDEVLDELARLQAEWKEVHGSNLEKMRSFAARGAQASEVRRMQRDDDVSMGFLYAHDKWTNALKDMKKKNPATTIRTRNHILGRQILSDLARELGWMGIGIGELGRIHTIGVMGQIERLAVEPGPVEVAQVEVKTEVAGEPSLPETEKTEPVAGAPEHSAAPDQATAPTKSTRPTPPVVDAEWVRSRCVALEKQHRAVLGEKNFVLRFGRDDPAGGKPGAGEGLRKGVKVMKKSI